MKQKLLSNPIDSMKELRFKFIKEANYNTNKYTKQLRRTTRQIIHKYKSNFQPSE